MRSDRSKGPGLLVVLGVIASTATLFAADSIRVTPLVRDGQVLVSFQLDNGFTEDVRAAIYSGLRTTFSPSSVHSAARWPFTSTSANAAEVRAVDASPVSSNSLIAW